MSMESVNQVNLTNVYRTQCADFQQKSSGGGLGILRSRVADPQEQGWESSGAELWILRSRVVDPQEQGWGSSGAGLGILRSMQGCGSSLAGLRILRRRVADPQKWRVVNCAVSGFRV